MRLFSETMFSLSLATALTFPAMLVAQTEKVPAPRQGEWAPLDSIAIPRTAAAPERSRIRLTGPERGMHVAGKKPTAYIENYATETPRVIVEWVGPETIVKDQPAEFELVIRNRGSMPIANVEITQAIPRGFGLLKANPEPKNVKGGQIWEIQRLDPDAEFRITLLLRPGVVGKAECDALVRYTTASKSRFRVVQPLLTVHSESNDTVLLGGQGICNITIENPGTGPLQDVVVNVAWTEGMAPRNSEFEIAELNAGETRSLRVLANARGLGEQTCKVVATARYGLRAESESKLMVLGANLVADISGPTFRYVNRPAEYTITVKNAGTAEATNCQLGCALPKAMGFESATSNGKFDSATGVVLWPLGTLAPGDEVQVKYTAVAKDRGAFRIRTRAIADRGVMSDDEHLTRVEGIAAMLVEVVDADDPIEIGAETLYEIVVHNQGTDFAKDVEMLVEIPEEMRVVGVQGPVQPARDGQKLTFTIPRLAPRADGVFRVRVKAVKAGDARFQIAVKSQALSSPVIEQESTKVYQD